MPDLVPVRRAKAAARRESSQEPVQLDPLWGPLGELDDVWERMVRRVLAAPGIGGLTHTWTPPVDVEETADAWIFEVELAGARREDLQVELTETELAISGEVRQRERAGVVRRSTRRVGTFHYRATLPPGVDPDRVEARFDNGILTVRVPRPDQSTRHRIRID